MFVAGPCPISSFHNMTLLEWERNSVFIGLFQKKSTHPPRRMARWKFSREGGVEGSGNPGGRGGFGPKILLRGSFSP